ncbi:hypothetical protein [Kitasatospora sp. NPDC002965]|uniref:hypothetical protein n=1 Tax=Kitasatospora sp. NPDC002965 TaxID=3154775 RepID=UPI0033B02F00
MVRLTRDSVAMGDDTDAPHAAELALREGATVHEAGVALLAARYPASVSGGRATWVLTVDGGAPLAVLAQQWAEPRALPGADGPLARFASADGAVRLHLVYRTQRDPDAEWSRLAGGAPLFERP